MNSRALLPMAIFTFLATNASSSTIWRSSRNFMTWVTIARSDAAHAAAICRAHGHKTRQLKEQGEVFSPCMSRSVRNALHRGGNPSKSVDECNGGNITRTQCSASAFRHSRSCHSGPGRKKDADDLLSPIAPAPHTCVHAVVF